jgi:hypothetical protein
MGIFGRRRRKISEAEWVSWKKERSNLGSGMRIFRRRRERILEVEWRCLE